MSITINADVRKMSQDEFGAIAFKVMGHVFDIHRELGRLFDETVYQAELANRCSIAQTEVRIEVRFRRLLGHVDLKALHWINIGQSAVMFRTLFPE